MNVQADYTGFITLLCVLAISIVVYKIKKSKNQKSEKTAGVISVSSGAYAEKAGSNKGDAGSNNNWIIAAVAAYLEEESAPVSAMAWTPSMVEKQGPWVNFPRIQKRLTRV